MVKRPATFYFAADLFSSRALFGNAALADAIQRASGTSERYEFKVILPQLCEPRTESARAIRNADIRSVVQADAAVFVFDGMELDSGMIAEFMVAKFCDIPSVILRTDFRSCGEHPECPWNVMLGFYPRCSVVQLNSMKEYKDLIAAQGEGRVSARNRDAARDSIEALQTFMDSIGASVAQALDKVMRIPATMPEELREPVYQWVRQFPGAEFDAELSAEDISEVIKRRFEAK